MTQPNPQATLTDMFPQSVAVLSKPSVATFEQFERRGGTTEAYIYVAVAALVSAVIAGFFGIFHHDVSAVGQFFSRLLLTLVGFGVFTGLVYVIGKSLFKGTGTYSEVAYTFALFYVPLAIVVTVIGALIPPIGWLLSLLYVYFGFLAVQSSMNVRDQTGAIVTLVLSGIGYAVILGILTRLF
ncbi:YIP1 family protein [Deinococcus radiomollis]|uniref:YIP1 family protein n=1 Tax=Deinococcus radiomollis TaxID=468916 RepID=UPI0038917AD9